MGQPFHDDNLEDSVCCLLDGTWIPMNVNSVKVGMHELKSANAHLKQQIEKLEEHQQNHDVATKQVSLS